MIYLYLSLSFEIKSHIKPGNICDDMRHFTSGNLHVNSKYNNV